MEEQHKHIDDLFREQLGNYTETPPPMAWAAIEKKLDQNNGRKRMLPWWPLLVLMLLGSTVTGYLAVENKWFDSKLSDKTITETTTGQQPNSNKTGTEKYSNNAAETTNNPAENTSAQEGTNGIPQTGNNDGINKADKNNSIGPNHINAQDRGQNTNTRTKSNNDRKKINGINNTTAPIGKNSRINATDATGGPITGTNSNRNIRSVDKDRMQNREGDHDKALSASGKGSKRNKPLPTEATAGPNKRADNAGNGSNKQYGSINPNNDKRRGKLARVNDGGKKALPSGEGGRSARKQVHNNDDQGYAKAKKNSTNSFDKPKNNKRLKNENDNQSNRNEPDSDPGYTIAGNAEPRATESNTSVKKLATDLPKPKRDPRDGIPVADYLSTNYGEKPSGAGDDQEETTSGKKNDATATDAGGGGGGGATSSATPKKKTGIEAGIKLGYERGLQSYTAGKEVVEIFAQFNISKKVVLMIQPTIKFARTNNAFSFEGGFYSTPSNSHVVKPDTPGQTHTYTHTYKQSYDSFYAKHSYEQKYQEFDIPIIFKYMIDKNLSLFAGLNIGIGKILKVKEEVSPTVTYNRTYTNVDSLTTAQPFDMIFAPHTGYAASTYNSEQYKNATSNPLRFGYLIGLSYQLNQRFLFDLMIQQNISGQTYIPNKDIRSIYTQPYVRFSIGYKLFGNKKETE